MKGTRTMLYWMLIGLGGLIGVVVVVAVIGSLLPKGHVARRSARLSAPPERVWAVLTDFAGAKAWRSDLKSVERLPDRDGHEVWRETRRDGSAIPFETTESEARRRLVRRIADPKLPFGGTWTFELVEENGGTRLTITENGQIYNPLFRAMSKLFDLSKTIETYLADLTRHMGGEPRGDS